MTRTIDADEVVTLLKRAVESRGADFVYTASTVPGEYSKPNIGCHYERNGEPSCIVGQVLSYLGASPQTLDEFDREESGHDGTGWDDIRSDAEARLGVEFTDDADRILGRAQAEQDSGGPWGSAVRAAYRFALGKELDLTAES